MSIKLSGIIVPNQVFSHMAVTSLHSLSDALTSSASLMTILRTVQGTLEECPGVFALAVSSFELRYAVYRGINTANFNLLSYILGFLVFQFFT